MHRPLTEDAQDTRDTQGTQVTQRWAVLADDGRFYQYNLSTTSAREFLCGRTWDGLAIRNLPSKGCNRGQSF